MARPGTCSKCGGRMARGLAIDHDYGNKRVGEWVEGAPQRGFFGVRLRGRKRLQVEAWRCERWLSRKLCALSRM